MYTHNLCMYAINEGYGDMRIYAGLSQHSLLGYERSIELACFVSNSVGSMTLRKRITKLSLSILANSGCVFF